MPGKACMSAACCWLSSRCSLTAVLLSSLAPCSKSFEDVTNAAEHACLCRDESQTACTGQEVLHRHKLGTCNGGNGGEVDREAARLRARLCGNLLRQAGLGRQHLPHRPWCLLHQPCLHLPYEFLLYTELYFGRNLIGHNTSLKAGSVHDATEVSAASHRAHQVPCGFH